MSRIIYTNEYLVDEEKPESTVVKQTRYGTFYSTVRCQECDKDIKNRWDGYYFADIKCEIKSQKMKLRLFKEREKEVVHLLNVAKQGKNNPAVVDFLERQLKVLQKEIGRIQEGIETVQKEYPNLVKKTLKKRRDFREKTRK